MKQMILSVLSFFVAISAFANTSNELPVHCAINIYEKANGEMTKETLDFEFKCDSYTAESTLNSKSGRFVTAAFSDESCTPQLITYDNKTKAASITAVSGGGLEVFNDKLVITSYILGVSSAKEAMSNHSEKSRVVIACSTDKQLLEEFVEDNK